MKSCPKCASVYADSFATCPRCAPIFKPGWVKWLFGGLGLVVLGQVLFGHSESDPSNASSHDAASSIDFTRPIFTKPETYGCSEPNDLRDITISAMNAMDRLGGTFESCSAFPPQQIVVMQRNDTGTLVKISVFGRPQDETEAVALWVFSGDLKN